MSKFSYVAINGAGERVTGTMSAPSDDTVRRALTDGGMTPLSVSRASRLQGSANIQIGRRTAKHATLAAFARQLNQYLRSGIPVTEALEEMAKTAPTGQIRDALEDITARVLAGATLSGAFGVHQRLFGEVFISYLESAEQTGTLEETTNRLAKMLARRAQIEYSIRGALQYPKFAGLVIAGMVIAMLIFLVPKFEELYASFDAELPAPTQFLIDASHRVPLFFVAVGVLGALGFVWHQRTRDNLDIGERVDRVRFRLPIFGRLSHRLVLYRWSSTFAGALESGVHVDDGLDLAARASGSRWVRKVTVSLKDAVLSGEQIGARLGSWPTLFPPMLRTMVNAGEKSGELARMLNESARVMDEETDADVETLKGKLNTLMILLLGLVAAGVIVALYLPILYLTSTAARGLGF